MGYKILDVKADIHEDIEKYMESLQPLLASRIGVRADTLAEDICDIVDKHFEKIER